MKKIILLLLLIAGNQYFAQNDFQQIKTELQKFYPEVDLENKLIIVSFWSDSKQGNAELFDELKRTLNVFEYAKLKGGKKGVVGVIICGENEKSLVTISLKKEQVTKPCVISANISEAAKSQNIVFDNEGNVIKKVSDSELFQSIQKLITR